jgi:hypothetical protein
MGATAAQPNLPDPPISVMKVSGLAASHCPLNSLICTIEFYGSAVVYRSAAGDKVGNW